VPPPVEELEEVCALIVIEPAQVAVWLLPPQLAAAVMLTMEPAPVATLFMADGLHVILLAATFVVPQVTAGLGGVCPTVIVAVAVAQVSLGFTVNVPQVAV
jgi:hypothetical protein